MYYVLSPEGTKQGPYPISDLQAWFTDGKMPANARLVDFNTSREITLGEAIGRSQTVADPSLSETASHRPDVANTMSYQYSAAYTAETSPTDNDRKVGGVIFILQLLYLFKLWMSIEIFKSINTAVSNLSKSGTPIVKIDPVTLWVAGIAVTIWVIAGIGILLGRKWGFFVAFVTFIICLIGFLYDVKHAAFFPLLEILGFTFPILLCYYAYIRLTGREGPYPL